jgi:hypothetical protein
MQRMNAIHDGKQGIRTARSVAVSGAEGCYAPVISP